MRFYTADECRELVHGRGFIFRGQDNLFRLPPSAYGGDGEPARSDVLFFNIAFTQTMVLARAIVSTLEEFDDCLMWVTNWCLSPSRENLHLYYRLRQSYGERTLIHEAPGHLFLGHERADLVTFVQMAILFDWTFHIVPYPAEHWIFVDDEVLLIQADDQATVDAAVGLVEPFCRRSSKES